MTGPKEVLSKQFEGFFSFATGEGSEEKNWSSVTKLFEKSDLPALSIVECHVIDYIGSAEDVRAIDISKKLDLTRGGVSKILNRLGDKELIQDNSLPGNKRSTVYTLTDKGQKVFDIHFMMHHALYEKIDDLAQTFTEEECLAISRFLIEVELLVRKPVYLDNLEQ